MTNELPAEDPVKAAIEQLVDGAAGAKNPLLNLEFVKQATRTLWMPQDMSEADKLDSAAAALALLQAIKPADEIEGMLATQMIGTHTAAMECLRRAMLPNQSFEVRDMNLKHAAKLMSIYIGQLEALNKSRGKAQQKVTVEHFHAEADARAVVGNVQAGRRSNATKAAPALSRAPGQNLARKVKKRIPVEQRRR